MGITGVRVCQRPKITEW